MGMVRSSSLFTTSNGHWNAFQLDTILLIVMTAISGFTDGNTMLKNIFLSPAPSIRAASMSGSGMPLIKLRARKILNASAAPGMMRPT